VRFPKAIQNLIDHFSKLPTVGPKTAERYVFYLLKQSPETLQALALSIAELKEKTVVCGTCFAQAESSPCHICADARRANGILCVVADTRDYLTIESTGQFQGQYFILGGEINQIEGLGPDKLNLKPLIDKIKNNGIKEIIFALDPTIEGETTVLYLVKLLRPFKIKLTRLARGLPMGADLEYVDELTLSNALKYRNEL
jgi:recombination protein RecR